ncbi:MAG UNVERIFIED_CONTAM: ribbon-helix-helix protein, CopG family [Thermobifida fusca]
MAKESRGAVVSVRLSEQEQAQLRLVADARGTSVSEVIRSYVAQEANRLPSGDTSSTAVRDPAVYVASGVTGAGDRGVRWMTGVESTSIGSTLVVSF